MAYGDPGGSQFSALMQEMAALRLQVKQMLDQRAIDKRDLEYELGNISARDAWQDSKSDNVQTGFPVTLRLYIPPGNDTRSIKQVLLNVWLDAFRSYGTAAALGGGTTTGPSLTTTTSQNTNTTTTPSLTTTSGPSLTTTTGQNSNTTTSETAHFHADEYGTGGPINWADPPNHTHYTAIHNTYTSGAHSHTLVHTHEIPAHTHEIPAHTHNLAHTHEIPAHTHTLNHTHTLVHGIYVDAGVASGCTILINTVDRTNALVGAASFSADRTSLDITQYVTKGLNAISITSATLGRIDAMVFANVYLNK